MDDVLATLSDEAAAVLGGLSASQTQATPAAYPEKWSIQQIVEHLLLTYRATVPAIQARLDKGSATRAVPTLGQRLGQFMIVSMGRFPEGRPAPAAVAPSRPQTLRSGDELARRMRSELNEVEAVTARAEELFGSKRAASHMILGPLSMEQWRGFHLVHGRHHLKQIRAIRKEHGF